MRRLSNAEEQAIARDRFKVKVEVLEGFLADGVPAGYEVPKSINKFREWTDSARNVLKIPSSTSTNRKESPHNVDLIDRADEAVRHLRLQSKPPRKPTSSLSVQLELAQREVKELTSLTARLVSQLQEAMHRADNAESNYRSAQDTIQRYRDTETELRRKVFEFSKKGPRPIT